MDKSIDDVNSLLMKSFTQCLSEEIQSKNSHLCVGLDISPENFENVNTTLSKLIDHSKRVIDATIDYAICYKPNLAFFERWGHKGYLWLEKIIDYVGNRTILIADAKRCDIGNSAKQYALSIFEYFNFDAVTINPYMGKDGIIPFIEYRDRGVFILCRTSNSSAHELQDIKIGNRKLYEEVINMAVDLNSNENIGLVVGATKPSEILSIRNNAPDLPFLIPGVGAQGGDLEKSISYGNRNGIAIINISRGICFAGDMSQSAIKKSAQNYLSQMREVLNG